MSNTQEKLRRNSKPRVHITYNVETEGSEKKVELPFIVGVITSLSGDTILEGKRELAFSQVTKDNLDEYLSKQKATLNYFVENKLVEGGDKIECKLSFENRESFEIKKIIEQIPELKQVYDRIKALEKVAVMASNNNKFSDLLTKAMIQKKHSELANQLKNKT